MAGATRDSCVSGVVVEMENDQLRSQLAQHKRKVEEARLQNVLFDKQQ